MKRTNQCPKCGSRSVIADAKVPNPAVLADTLEIVTYQNPEAYLFTGKQKTTLSAWVCADCGYVEFYADSPGTIRTA